MAVNLDNASAGKGEITVLGGDQIRPNIPLTMLQTISVSSRESADSGNLQPGFENLSIAEIADKVARVTGATVRVKPSMTRALIGK